jgi:hypothetical protein
LSYVFGKLTTPQDLPFQCNRTGTLEVKLAPDDPAAQAFDELVAAIAVSEPP